MSSRQGKGAVAVSWIDALFANCLRSGSTQINYFIFNYYIVVSKEFPKNISHTDLPIVLGNLTSYVKHLPFPISKDIVPLFVRLFRKLKSIHKEMDDDNVREKKLQLATGFN